MASVRSIRQLTSLSMLCGCSREQLMQPILSICKVQPLRLWAMPSTQLQTYSLCSPVSPIHVHPAKRALSYRLAGVVC